MGSDLFYMAAMVLKPHRENLRAKELNQKRARGIPILFPHKHTVPGLGPQEGNRLINCCAHRGDTYISHAVAWEACMWQGAGVTMVVSGPREIPRGV